MAFLANQIRTYFGDGSEFGVRMVYATEDSRSARPARSRNAMDELDERFLVISGDVLTDIDLGADRRTSTRSTRRWPRSASSRSRTRSSSASSSPTRTAAIERFLEKPTWGQVFSDTINTGIFVLEPEIFDYIAADRPGRLLERGLPRAAGGRAAAVRRRGRGLLGGRRHPRGLRAAPTRTCSTARWQVDIPGFELSHGVWLGEGAEVHPEAEIEGSAVIGDYCRVDAGARIGDYTVLGSNVRVRGDADLERAVVHDNAYLGEARPAAGHGGRPGQRPAPRRPLRGRRRCSATSASSARTPSSAPGVKVYPFKTVETGRDRQLLDRLGVHGAPAACSGATASPGWPTSTSRPSWPPGWPWPTPRTLKKDATVIMSRDSSRAARMLKRAMMAGLNAGGRRTCSTSRSPRCPVTRFLVRQPRGARRA